MAIQDHLQTEEHLLGENSSSITSDFSISKNGIGSTAAVESTAGKAFDQLRSLCINTNARESLAVSNHSLKAPKRQTFRVQPVPSYIRDKIK